MMARAARGGGGGRRRQHARLAAAVHGVVGDGGGREVEGGGVLVGQHAEVAVLEDAGQVGGRVDQGGRAELRGCKQLNMDSKIVKPCVVKL